MHNIHTATLLIISLHHNILLQLIKWPNLAGYLCIMTWYLVLPFFFSLILFRDGGTKIITPTKRTKQFSHAPSTTWNTTIITNWNIGAYCLMITTLHKMLFLQQPKEEQKKKRKVFSLFCSNNKSFYTPSACTTNVYTPPICVAV